MRSGLSRSACHCCLVPLNSCCSWARLSPLWLWLLLEILEPGFLSLNFSCGIVQPLPHCGLRLPSSCLTSTGPKSLETMLNTSSRVNSSFTILFSVSCVSSFCFPDKAFFKVFCSCCYFPTSTYSFFWISSAMVGMKATREWDRILGLTLWKVRE